MNSKNASVKAPHYLAIYSENKDDYLVNVGFMFQQFSLYLTEIGIGSCWSVLENLIPQKII